MTKLNADVTNSIVWPSILTAKQISMHDARLQYETNICVQCQIAIQNKYLCAMPDYNTNICTQCKILKNKYLCVMPNCQDMITPNTDVTNIVRYDTKDIQVHDKIVLCEPNV